MTDPIAYSQIETEDIVARFKRDGVVSVRVPFEHAVACDALVELLSAVRRQQGLTRRARMGLLLRGLYLTLRVVAFHSRLMNLTSLLVLEDARCARNVEPDGGSVFLFERSVEPAAAVDGDPV